MFELNEKSLNDLPEGVKNLFHIQEGKLMLDVENVKTVADVQAVKDAKDREKAERNTLNAELSIWKQLNKSPDEVRSILAEYPALKEKNISAKDFAEMKSAKEKAEKDLKELQDARKSDLAENEELKKFKTQVKVAEAWKPVRKELSEKYEPDMIDILFDDNIGKFKLNEDQTQFETLEGKSVKDFMEIRLKAFNAVRKNTPSPDINLKNTPKNELNNGVSLIDENIRKQL